MASFPGCFNIIGLIRYISDYVDEEFAKYQVKDAKRTMYIVLNSSLGGFVFVSSDETGICVTVYVSVKLKQDYSVFRTVY